MASDDTACEGLFDHGDNRLTPPITSIAYGLALALTSYMSTYDYIVQQPIILGPEETKLWREIMSKPGKPLTDQPLPLDEFDV